MKKGFTLVEVIAVIVILGVVISIAVPAINVSLKTAREGAYQEQIKRIEDTAKKYVLENTDLLPDDDTAKKYILINDLVKDGYLESEEIINPVTNATMVGCVEIEFLIAKNKYSYTYLETCPVS